MRQSSPDKLYTVTLLAIYQVPARLTQSGLDYPLVEAGDGIGTQELLYWHPEALLNLFLLHGDFRAQGF